MEYLFPQLSRVLSQHHPLIPVLCPHLFTPRPLPSLSLSPRGGRKTHGSISRRRGGRTWPDSSLGAVSPGPCSPSHPATSLSLWGPGNTASPSALWTHMCGCCSRVLSVRKETAVSRARLFLAAPAGQSPSRRACELGSVRVLPSPGAGLHHHGDPWTHRSSRLSSDPARAPRGPPVTPPPLFLSQGPLALGNARTTHVVRPGPTTAANT